MAKQGNDALLTCPQAAEVLGLHVDTVRRYIKAGTLDHVRMPGGSLRVPRAVVDRYLGLHGGPS